MDSEEAFPRGRPKPLPKSSVKRRSGTKEDDPHGQSLFSERNSNREKSELHKSKRKKLDEDSQVLRDHGAKDEKEVLEEREVVQVDFLHAKKVQDGTLLLGCIKEVHDIELVVSLPHCNTGYVQATRISRIYNNLLQQDLDDVSEENSKLPTLESMFEVGQLVVCSVVSVAGSALQLTLDPSVINKYLTTSSFFVGQIIVGVVKSKEDHGFTVDIGKNKINAFLPMSETYEIKLGLGCVIRCIVTEVRGEGTILLLSADERKISKSLVKPSQGISLDTLQPGMIGNFLPKERSKVGAVGKFLDFNASVCALDGDIDKLKLESDDDDDFGKREKRLKLKGKKKEANEGEAQNDPKSKKIKCERLVRGCVLYINTLTKHVSVGINPFFMNKDIRQGIFKKYEQSYPFGHKCQVTVKKYIKGLGAILQIKKSTDDVLSFCASKHLCDEKSSHLDDLMSQEKTFPARVMHSVSMDGAVILTLKKSIVDSEFISYDGILPGSTVDCHIQSLKEHGVLVNLGKGSYSPIRGFIPLIHLADVTLHHPEKRFSVGDVISCKVLSVDKIRKKVQLTHKRTLVQSKLPVVNSYQQLQPGDLAHGYIASIKPFGVFVNFYNNVHGIVPNSELSTDFIENPDKVFYVGQVMKCRVLKCDAEKEELRLSFVLKPRTGGANSSVLFKGVDVEILNKNDSGLAVLVINKERPRSAWRRSTLPTMHLSDFPSLSRQWLSVLEIGSILESCMVINDKEVTRKKSVLRGQETEEGDKTYLAFSDLKEDLVSHGFIKKVLPYGVFVHLPVGLIGLCPISKMADRFLASTEGYYEEGQSVIAKVMEIDQQKKRFIVSLKQSDVPTLDHDSVLESYLMEHKEILKLANKSWPDQFSIGKQFDVTLTGEVAEDNGAKCECSLFPEGFIGRVVDVNEEMSGRVKAKLLFFDVAAKVLVLSADAKLSAQSKKRKSGSVTEATVKHANEDVAVVSLQGGNSSTVAVTLTRSHPNHSNPEDHVPWKVNEKIDVVTTRCTDGGLALAKAKIHESNPVQKSRRPAQPRIRGDSESTDVSCTAEVNFGNLQVGQEVEGMVRSVRMNCILVRLSESEMEGGYRGHPVTGRLHISELEDEPKPGLMPMKKCQSWNKIKCRVIGFRDVRTHHFLAITNRNSTRCVLELSLRKPHADICIEDLKVGQSLKAFSNEYLAKKEQMQMEISLLLRGFIPFLLMSDNPVKSLELTHSGKKTACWDCVITRVYANSVGLAGKGAMVDRETQIDVQELKEDCVTNGRIVKLYESNVILSLPYNGIGKVHITDVADEFVDEPFADLTVGRVVRCAVISCPTNKSMILSLRKSKMLPDKSAKEINAKDKEVTDVKALKPGDVVRGYIKNFSQSGVFVALSRTITARVELAKASKYYIHDTSIVEGIFREGRLVQCKILGISQMEGRVSLSLLERDTGLPDLVPEQLVLPLRHGKEKEKKRKDPGVLLDKICMSKKKKMKLERMKKGEWEKKGGNKERRDSGVYDDDPSEGSPASYIRIVSQNKPAASTEDPGFSWDPAAASKEAGEKQSGDSSDSENESDNEDEVVHKKAPKKRTKKEKEAEEALEEAELREKEEALTKDNVPQTAMDWDRLVLSSPLNSMIWVRYMAFHLHSTEIEKAKEVAERAIKTIDFREEDEKWNVWVALLNLENMFGTEHSLHETFERATQHNDPLKVNTHMVSLYEKSKQFDKAEQLCAKMVRKFRGNKNVWLLYLNHLMQRKERTEASEIFKRCLRSLDKNCHLEIISKFGQLEYKFGDPEEGRILFENALANYPKRSDIWSIYIDMLTKMNRIEGAREVYERVTTLNLSTKNMRSFFKRFIDFEKINGTDDSVADVRQKAMDFIESKTNNVME